MIYQFQLSSNTNEVKKLTKWQIVELMEPSPNWEFECLMGKRNLLLGRKKEVIICAKVYRQLLRSFTRREVKMRKIIYDASMYCHNLLFSANVILIAASISCLPFSPIHISLMPRGHFIRFY